MQVVLWLRGGMVATRLFIGFRELSNTPLLIDNTPFINQCVCLWLPIYGCVVATSIFMVVWLQPAYLLLRGCVVATSPFVVATILFMIAWLHIYGCMVAWLQPGYLLGLES